MARTPARTTAEAYERGYNTGYHAGRRRAARGPNREAVVQAVERALRERFASSAPSTDQEWRMDAEAVADAALATVRTERAEP